MSLLTRVQSRDARAWERLVFLYTPLIYHWCREAGLAEMDAADVGQEVFCAVAQLIADFRYRQGPGTFRRWLWKITRNRIRAFQRREHEQPRGIGGSDALNNLAGLLEGGDEDERAVDAVREEQFLCRRAAELVRRDVEEKSWSAFWRVTVEGHLPADVAADLGISANAVYLARVRILARLRQEFEGLIALEGEGGAPAAGAGPGSPRPNREACDGTG